MIIIPKQNKLQKQMSHIRKWLKIESELERLRFDSDYSRLGIRKTRSLLKRLEKINKEKQIYKRRFGRDRGY